MADVELDTLTTLDPGGTSFPGSPSTGDHFVRTDLGYTRFFYDGTRWLSDVLHTVAWTMLAELPHSAGKNVVQAALDSAGMDLWIERWSCTYRVETTLDASNYWTFQLRKHDGSTQDEMDELSTIAGAADTVGRVGADVDASVDVSDELHLRCSVTIEAGSPGNLDSFAITVYYRYTAS